MIAITAFGIGGAMYSPKWLMNTIVAEIF